MTNAELLETQLHRPWTRELTQDGDVVAARIVELDGCFSEGSSMEEALANLQEALELWLEAAIESGAHVPEPRAEFAAADYSGRFTVRVAKSRHRELAEAAEREGLSLSQLVSGMLSDRQSAPREAPRSEQSASDIREDIAADAIVRSAASIGALKGIATHLRNLGSTNLACLVYAFAAERVARDSGAQEAAKELGTAAALAHRSGSNALAESLWRESVRLDMTNVRSASRLGQLLHHQGRYEEAADLLELAAADDNYAANFLGWSRIQLGLHQRDDELIGDGMETVAAALRKWAYQANASERRGWLRQVRTLSRLGSRATPVVDQLISYANANSNWGPTSIADVSEPEGENARAIDAVPDLDPLAR